MLCLPQNLLECSKLLQGRGSLSPMMAPTSIKKGTHLTQSQTSSLPHHVLKMGQVSYHAKISFSNLTVPFPSFLKTHIINPNTWKLFGQVKVYSAPVTANIRM